MELILKELLKTGVGPALLVLTIVIFFLIKLIFKKEDQIDNMNNALTDNTVNLEKLATLIQTLVHGGGQR